MPETKYAILCHYNPYGTKFYTVQYLGHTVHYFKYNGGRRYGFSDTPHRTDSTISSVEEAKLIIYNHKVYMLWKESPKIVWQE